LEAHTQREGKKPAKLRKIELVIAFIRRSTGGENYDCGGDIQNNHNNLLLNFSSDRSQQI